MRWLIPREGGNDLTDVYDHDELHWGTTLELDQDIKGT